MGTYVYSVRIEATPGQVWHTYVDPRRIPDWQTGRPVIEDVRGDPGEPESSYVSRRGPLSARTTIVAATVPEHLVSSTDAYFGMQLTVTSRLTARSGGTDLEMTAETDWPRRRRWLGRLVDRAVLSPREADKELTKLKALVEGEAAP